MTVEQNKAIVRKQFDAIQRGDWDEFDKLHDPHFVNHAVGGIQPGIEPFKKILRALHETFPDELTTIDDMIAEGDKVVVRSTLKSTHHGTALQLFAGIKPEGKPIEWHFIHIFRLRDSKIVEHWAERNDLEVRQQLQS